MQPTHLLYQPESEEPRQVVEHFPQPPCHRQGFTGDGAGGYHFNGYWRNTSTGIVYLYREGMDELGQVAPISHN